ncbi:GGDEF domain-containing protein [Candidatus Magnetominusculus xianensis]|uniref:diguanylate cyclase n=1 Tax=Candidatus Magnetominusculus xianensis TaxID=1748249 RepID=A0ABR5SDM5_9BACT|nr:GGDEF domain-containing protein [Candidatus Magnetominusculus xianensis]KWT81161.1 diguanylate cyclase [Candidatus Magnetominusculus xianensis]MBF0404324.1 GGDEF domain-containing protein [Nitrospirota bacterium]
MTREMSRGLYLAIKELHNQEYSAHTIHQIIYGLKDSLGITSAVLVEKNRTNDYLEIKNRYNISEQFSRTYRRGIGTDLVGRIFYHDELAVVIKGESESDYKDIFLEHDYEMAVVLRISTESRAIGFLALYFDKKEEITDELSMFLIAMATVCSEAIRKEVMDNCMKETRTIDPHTGLLYYLYFHNRLKDEATKSKRMQIPLTVAIMDMDNFKDVMSVYGIETANNLYKELAAELRSCIRGIDVVGRYGTDEFILYMPNTSLENAEMVLTRFVNGLGTKDFTSHHLHTSLSIGITTLHHDESLEELLNKAQRALYKAKLTKDKISKCDE